MLPMPEKFDLKSEPISVHGSDGRTILSLPALFVPQGSLAAIKGPSGAGKSTFLYTLAGLMSDVRGKLYWGGMEILRLSEGKRANFRAANIGLVFQDFHLFEELGPLENASVSAHFRPAPDRTAIRDRAQHYLIKLGIDPTSRTVASFSGGERQRVAIARALASDAPILLADEPTASLDRVSANHLIEDLVALARESGKTFIAVSHDQTLIDHMDRVFTISDGVLSDDWSAQ